MPRNSSGVYSLPQAPFVSGTVISSSAVNSNFSDIATALTGSLPTNGSTGMTGQFKAADGSTLLPGISFVTDTSLGFNHPSSNTIGVSVSGVQIGTFTSAGWNGSVTAGVPIGTVVDFMGSSAPTLWYLCYGQAVSRTTYSALFAVIGTTYGAGDGLTTFNLPDLRGVSLAGLDNMGGSAANRLTNTYFGASSTTLGTLGGAQNHSVLQANLPNVNFTHSGTTLNDPQHSHTFSTAANASVGAIPKAGDSSVTNTGTTAAASTGITVSAQGSAASGGSGTPLATIQPTLVINKIIYAGA
jgi:microcystin-dependent protein